MKSWYRVVATTVIVFQVSACAQSLAGVGQLAPSAQPAASVSGIPQDAKILAIDAPMRQCLGSADSRTIVVEIASGSGFGQLFPHAGLTPELDSLAVKVDVVVYRHGWPGMLAGRPDAQPRVLEAGTWDVCVERPDGGDIDGIPFIVYGDIPQTDSPITAR